MDGWFVTPCIRNPESLTTTVSFNSALNTTESNKSFPDAGLYKFSLVMKHTYCRDNNLTCKFSEMIANVEGLIVAGCVLVVYEADWSGLVNNISEEQVVVAEHYGRAECAQLCCQLREFPTQHLHASCHKRHIPAHNTPANQSCIVLLSPVVH